MPQTVCSKSYFPDNGALIGNGSIGIYPIVNGHIGGTFVIDNSQRPFIPLVGLVESLTSPEGYDYDTLANNVTHKNLFVTLAQDAYQASLDFSNNVVSPNTIITGDFDKSYLYKKLFDKVPMINRYYNIYKTVWDFYNTAGAWTAEQFYNNITALINKLGKDADKFLYLPPFHYFFGAGANSTAVITAWKAANPNFVAVLGLEIYI